MNKEWAEWNRSMQVFLKKEDTFSKGIAILLQLRETLLEELYTIRKEVNREAFNQMPYKNATGYHNKTIAYSLWHIFRIEDIVAHTLIDNNEQIFLQGDYQKRMNSPIITTGNELYKNQIIDFSAMIHLDALYDYLVEVKNSTDALLKTLSFQDCKRNITEEQKNYLRFMQVVSDDDRAHWLIDYWCGKDIRGLIQMPFSRHWIMHVEAALRIKQKILTSHHKARDEVVVAKD